jgi:ABC-type antimicrobial peptide transport system permease subunit
VTAIYRRGLGFANLTLPAAVLRPHTATGLDSLVLVADSPGADHTSVLAALTRAIRGQDPAAKVATRPTGSATPYIPPGGWLAVIGGTILLGMAGTLLPIFRVFQIPPIEAIGTQE